VQVWTDPGFLQEVHRWIGEHTKVTGPIEQTHVQIWSTVFRAPTTDGTVWFKAPDDVSEGPLTQMLAAERWLDLP